MRFVFPPYQVGPYADGTQTVDVPAAILLPHLAPRILRAVRQILTTSDRRPCRSNASRNGSAIYLREADIRIDGERPWDLQVHDPHFYARVLGQGSLGLGESYMDEWWDAESLDGLLFHLLAARLDQRVHGAGEIWDALRARLINLQTRDRSREVGERHYDLGNDLYAAMLGKRLVYSCGYWTQADGRVLDGLDAAQEAKLDLVCRKLAIAAGHARAGYRLRLGRGAEIRRRALRHQRGGDHDLAGSRPTTRASCAPDCPSRSGCRTIANCDEPFDAAFSIGMFEHVGVKNYRDYFEVARRCLAEGRTVPAAQHRQQPFGQPHRPVDRTLHLPQLDAAVRRPGRAKPSKACS